MKECSIHTAHSLKSDKSHDNTDGTHLSLSMLSGKINMIEGFFVIILIKFVH